MSKRFCGAARFGWLQELGAWALVAFVLYCFSVGATRLLRGQLSAELALALAFGLPVLLSLVSRPNPMRAQGHED